MDYSFFKFYFKYFYSAYKVLVSINIKKKGKLYDKY